MDQITACVPQTHHVFLPNVFPPCFVSVGKLFLPKSTNQIKGVERLLHMGLLEILVDKMKEEIHPVVICVLCLLH